MIPKTILNSSARSCIRDPKEIAYLLDEYIIGQYRAKQTLATAFLQHTLRMLDHFNMIKLDNLPPKSNVLLIGPTGCGKTALIKALGEIINLPVTVIDVTGTTSGGYIGKDVEDLLLNHVENTRRWVKENHSDWCNTSSEQDVTTHVKRMAEVGILYLDEFDKARRSSSNNTSGRDINGESVQQELLKILENSKVQLSSPRKRLNQTEENSVELFDTKNLLVICGGAFVGLDEIILNRLNKNSGIGFSSKLTKMKESVKDIVPRVTVEDLTSYGFIPEILGRLPLVTTLSPLTEKELCDILTKSKHSLLSQYQYLFELFGVDLVFNKSALSAIAKKAISLKTGARSLQNLVGKILEKYQYNICSYDHDEKITITADIVEKQLNEPTN